MRPVYVYDCDVTVRPVYVYDCNVTVRPVQPTISGPVQVTESDTTFLTCDYSGTTLPLTTTYTWTKDSSLISGAEDKKYEISTPDFDSAGEYVCQITANAVDSLESLDHSLTGKVFQNQTLPITTILIFSAYFFLRIFFNYKYRWTVRFLKQQFWFIKYLEN